jgi:hypothetical protein
MLGLLRNRQSVGWQRSLKSTAADAHPVVVDHSPTDNPNFPWQKLQEHTDNYIKKKKKLTPEQVEVRLIEFVQNSTESLDMAIAACGHALRPQTLRKLLADELNPGPGKNIAMSGYLQAICAANRVNSEAVNDIEANRVKSLMSANIVGMSSPGNYLGALVQILIDGVPPNFLIYQHVHTLAEKACIEFATQLETLRADGNLYRACGAALWLSTVSDRCFRLSPGNLVPEQLLDTWFPSWRIWAAWKPDIARLRLWNDRFTNQQRLTLRNLLAFEGPDIHGRQSTLREGSLCRGLNVGLATIRVGNLDFERQLAIEARMSIDRLLEIVDAASAAGPSDVDLLAHFCVGKIITSGSLDILEIIRSADDASISTLLLPIYNASTESRMAQMAAAMKLLPLLDHRTSPSRDRLRDIITPRLIDLVEGGMENLQSILQNQLLDGTMSDTDIK